MVSCSIAIMKYPSFFLGVDNWGVLHTHLVAAYPDFNRSSNACRMKWKSLYDDYKTDYTTNGISGNEKSLRSKFYSLIDGYMHERANVMKQVHGGVDDDDPNTEPQKDDKDLQETMGVSEPASTSKVQGKRKLDKMVAQQAITLMAELSVKLTDAMKDSKAAKLTILQGMLSTMNELVRKL